MFCWCALNRLRLLVARHQLLDASGQWVIVAAKVLHNIKMVQALHLHQLNVGNAPLKHLEIYFTI
jgi:hypothetical protein